MDIASREDNRPLSCASPYFGGMQIFSTKVFKNTIHSYIFLVTV